MSSTRTRTASPRDPTKAKRARPSPTLRRAVAKASRKPSVPPRRRPTADRASTVTITPNVSTLPLDVGDGRKLTLTNLDKLFWPSLNITKRDLLQYYARMAPFLLPHLVDRAMVMKRYPHGAEGDYFFMKRAPTPRPDWIETCRIPHKAGDIDFPMIQDVPSLLWVVNLGCVDLNPWYSRCDDTDRPDYLHFDLDPTAHATFPQVLETALLVRKGLEGLGLPCYAKTTGASGIHVYVPIQRGPTQKEVWTFAKSFAIALALQVPKLVTAEYRISKRPPKHVLVDYNQNAWGRTLASVYSVRPQPRATVSTPLTWNELEHGVTVESFRIDTVPKRVETMGDLWAPLLEKRGRVRWDRIRLERSTGRPAR